MEARIAFVVQDRWHCGGDVYGMHINCGLGDNMNNDDAKNMYETTVVYFQLVLQEIARGKPNGGPLSGRVAQEKAKRVLLESDSDW